MKAKSAIQKGKDLENYVCEQLVDKSLDQKAYRSHGSGNGITEKADIWTSLTLLGRNAGIECKNHAVPHIKDWWEQTQKLEKLGREPILVYKLKGEGMGEVKAVVYLDTLLELIKLANSSETRGEIIQDNSQSSQKTIWELKRLKDQINKVIKLIE